MYTQTSNISSNINIADANDANIKNVLAMGQDHMDEYRGEDVHSATEGEILSWQVWHGKALMRNKEKYIP
jgi:hypothetical protein